MTVFGGKVNKFAESVDVNEPQLPRQRKLPRRYETGQSSGDFHTSVNLYFRQLYYEAIDNITNCLKSRFEQPGYKIYCNLETLLRKAAKKEAFEDELRFVCSFYKDDFKQELLSSQLLTFGIDFQRGSDASGSDVTIFDIRDYFQSLGTGKRELLSQVCQVMKLLLVMPATNATSERSFSALRRVKNYLRSSMTQKRLNDLMILHVHKELTDALHKTSIASEFIEDCDSRRKMFGKF